MQNRLLLLPLFGLLALPINGMGEAVSPPPNIVLFLTDDQGWNGTSVAMDQSRKDSRSDFYHTPALEQFAEEGLRFSQGYAPHPNCSPTRMSIQTGKSPARLGSTDILDVVTAERGYGRMFYERFYLNKPMQVPLPIGALPAEEITIAEFIKEHLPQYATAHFGKWHLNGGSPGEHGYDQHDGPTSNQEGTAGVPDPKLLGEVTDRSVGFIQNQVAADRPFFLQVSHYAVHTPVLAQEDTIAEFEQRASGDTHSNAAYGAMTRELDNAFRVLLKALDDLGIADNTYVIYTSDNGGEIGSGSDPTVNTPLAKGKTHTWEGGIRVPLLVRGPGVPAGSQSDVPAIGWDFFPTITELLGIGAPLPGDLDGGSLVGILHDPSVQEVSRPSDDLFWYYPHYRDMKGVRPQAALRSGTLKLRKEFETGTIQLFDLSEDLSESNDLSAVMPDKAKQLEVRLDQHLVAVGAELPVLNPDYDPAQDRGQQRRGLSRGASTGGGER